MLAFIIRFGIFMIYSGHMTMAIHLYVCCLQATTVSGW
jgi:hypothetical protein